MVQAVTERYQHLMKEPDEWSAMSVQETRGQLQIARLKPLPGQISLSIQAEESGIGGFSIGDLTSVRGQATEIVTYAENMVDHPERYGTTIVFEADGSADTVCKDDQGGCV